MLNFDDSEFPKTRKWLLSTCLVYILFSINIINRDSLFSAMHVFSENLKDNKLYFDLFFIVVIIFFFTKFYFQSKIYRDEFLKINELEKISNRLNEIRDSTLEIIDRIKAFPSKINAVPTNIQDRLRQLDTSISFLQTSLEGERVPVCTIDQLSNSFREGFNNLLSNTPNEVMLAERDETERIRIHTKQILRESIMNLSTSVFDSFIGCNIYRNTPSIDIEERDPELKGICKAIDDQVASLAEEKINIINKITHTAEYLLLSKEHFFVVFNNTDNTFIQRKRVYLLDLVPGFIFFSLSLVIFIYRVTYVVQ